MNKEDKTIADITFKMDSNCWQYLKAIPKIHRDTFIHYAVMEAVNSDLYKVLSGDVNVNSLSNNESINIMKEDIKDNIKQQPQQQKSTTWDDF